MVKHLDQTSKNDHLFLILVLFDIGAITQGFT